MGQYNTTYLKNMVENELGLYFYYPQFSKHQVGGNFICCVLQNSTLAELEGLELPVNYVKDSLPFEANYSESLADGKPIFLQYIPKQIPENLSNYWPTDGLVDNHLKPFEITEPDIIPTIKQYLEELEKLKSNKFNPNQPNVGSKVIVSREIPFLIHQPQDKFCITLDLLSTIFSSLSVNINEISSEIYPPIKFLRSKVPSRPIQLKKRIDSKTEAPDHSTPHHRLSLCSDLHPNILPVLVSVECEQSIYLLCEFHPHPLDDCLKFTDVLEENNKRLFFTYQLFSILNFCHSRGIGHGNMSPSLIMLTKQLWMKLAGFQCNIGCGENTVADKTNPLEPKQEGLKKNINPSQLNCRIPMIISSSQTLVEQWINGRLSNYDYLYAINRISGRQPGNPNYHPVFPWVIDFSCCPFPQPGSSSGVGGPWRDLTRTKYRLTKGDEQLDITYNSSDIPHHITEPISELTYYNYVARRTPVSLLKKFVRSKYHPNEYPQSMERLYTWTPDECIPQFYSDPDIFISMHEDMEDLKIPAWANDREDFIRIHREALESDYISANLHHWIDLTFGYKLTGAAAIEAKNVAFMGRSMDRNHGFVQLFTQPHPKKVVFSQKNFKKSQLRPSRMINQSNKESTAPLKADLSNVVLNTPQSGVHTPPPASKFNQPNLNKTTGKGRTILDFAPAKVTQLFFRKKNEMDGEEEELVTSGSIQHSVVEKVDKSPFEDDDSAPPSPVGELENDKEQGDIEISNSTTNLDSTVPILDFLSELEKAPMDLNPSSLSKSRPKDPLESDTSYVDDLLDYERSCQYSDEFSWQSPFYGYDLGERDDNKTNDLNSPFLIIKSLDMIAAACIVYEVYCGASHPMFSHSTFKLFQEKKFMPKSDKMPRNLFQVLINIIESALKMRTEKNIKSKLYDFNDALNSSAFPSYFKEVYNFLLIYHVLDESDRAKLVLDNIEFIVHLPMEGFKLLLPFILPFFSSSNRNIVLDAIFMLESISTKLERPLTIQHLMVPLENLYDKITTTNLGESDVEDGGELEMKLLSIETARLLILKFGFKCFVETFLKHFILAMRTKYPKLAQQASATILKLMKKPINPILYLKHIIYKLIKQLTKTNLEVVIDNLAKIGIMIHKTALIYEYFRQLLLLIQKYTSRQSHLSIAKGGSIISNIFCLINQVIPHLSKELTFKLFVENTNTIFSLLLNPFPDAGAFKLLARTVSLIAAKIGDAHTSTHVLPRVHQFLNWYDSFKEKSGTDVKSEYRELLSQSVEEYLFTQFNPILKADQSANLDLLSKFPSATPVVELENERILPNGVSLVEQNEVPAWLELLENPDIALNENTIQNWTFSWNIAHSYKEHNTSPLKLLSVHCTEDFFASASKDGLIKCWKLDNTKAIFEQHRPKPVTDLCYLERGNCIAACDGEIHIWECESEVLYGKLENENPYTCIYPYGPLLISGSTNTISLHDTRMLSKTALEWYIPKNGEPKAITINSSKDFNIIVVGQSNGYVSLIDKRTGYVMNTFRQQTTNAINKFKSYNSKYLISSTIDQILLYDINQSLPTLVKAFTFSRDYPLNFDVSIETGKLYAVSAQKILSFSLDDLDSPPTSLPYRVPKNPLKQHLLTTINFLPLHQLVLLGNDNGDINVCY